MKLINLVALLSAASATILIETGEEVLKQGRSYDVRYLMDTPYSLRLELVQKGTQPNIAWSTVKTLFEDLPGRPCNGSYEAVVDITWPTSENGELYALWIQGTEASGVGGWADLTSWFTVEKA